MRWHERLVLDLLREEEDVIVTPDRYVHIKELSLIETVICDPPGLEAQVEDTQWELGQTEGRVPDRGEPG